MASQLKGNLGLKSSPLAPTACKLSTQYLILDHMTNHYNKIAKAKSAIDSKPPKSLSTSQKLRDRRNREKIVHSPRPRPITSMCHDGFQQYQDILNDEPEDEEDKLVHSIMKSALLDKSASSTIMPETQRTDTRNLDLHYQGGRDSRYNITYSARPGSARSVLSGHSLGPSASRLPISGTSHDPTKITYQGDVLEKRPYLFTEPERPFTPRTLKNNHQSRLKNSKCYNPPPKKDPRSNGAKQSQLAPEVRTAPRPRPRSGVTRKNGNSSGVEDEESRRRRDSFHGLGETLETTGQLSESMLMDITLRSRDGRHYQHSEGLGLQNGGHGQNVPPLAISMDQDHMHWLKEQASKAQVRARNRDQLRSSSLHSDEEALRPTMDNQDKYHEDSETNEMIKKEAMQKYYDRMAWTSASKSRSFMSCTSSTSWVSQCIMEQEEDQKYLAFAKEVTDDVLSRGICTDSVLNRVFENHIERKKNELDVTRMRKVIQDLRRDLGLRDSSAERTPHAALSDANYNNRNVTAPVTVVTNGENGSHSSNQLPSSSSKGTTDSTSAKDESSSTLSPANQMRGILERGNRSKNNLMATSTTLEPLHVMSSPSENGGLTSSATMESVSSFKFGQTGDMVDTITSDAIQEDTAREREEEAEEKAEEVDRDSESNELTATQALKQYEFDLTVKEGTAEQSATNDNSSKEESEEATNISSKKAASRKSKLERPATGERRMDEESNGEDAKSDSPNERGGEGAKNNHRFRRREEQQRRRIARAMDDSSRTGSGGSNQTASAPEASATNVEEDGASVKSSTSSQRPSARPRRSKLQSGVSVESRGQEQERGHSTNQDRSLTEESEQETDAKALQKSSNGKVEESKDEDYEDDYEEEEEEAEDVDESTHRTSDDDF